MAGTRERLNKVGLCSVAGICFFFVFVFFPSLVPPCRPFIYFLVPVTPRQQPLSPIGTLSTPGSPSVLLLSLSTVAIDGEAVRITLAGPPPWTQRALSSQTLGGPPCEEDSGREKKSFCPPRPPSGFLCSRPVLHSMLPGKMASHPLAGRAGGCSIGGSVGMGKT